MLKHLILVCALFTAVLSHVPDVAILEERMPNGDENEIVSIDLKKRDGSEDIILTAQLQLHLDEGQVYINGYPLIHGLVNSVRMHVSIVEIERGIQKAQRLAPAMLRVLVIEKSGDNGNKRLLAEVEFVQVEKYEVLQVDVKQIMWEGSNCLPMTSVSFEDSIIHHKPHQEDRPIIVKDDFQPPRHFGKHHGKQDHEHHDQHLRYHPCWFNHLSIGKKILVTTGAVLICIALLNATIFCWKRRGQGRNINVQTTVDNDVEVKGCDNNDIQKEDVIKVTAKDDQFHMEINEGYVGDKKNLIE